VTFFSKLFPPFRWGRGVADHVFFEDNEVIDFQITFGSLPNHHCILDSLENKQPDIPYDDSLFASSSGSNGGGGSGRFTDPGAGAFSYSMGRSFVAKRDLTAGSEMYVYFLLFEIFFLARQTLMVARVRDLTVC
jgi:hypothetical protein